MEYLIRRAMVKPELQGLFDSPAWGEADVAEIASFHPASTDHRPRTQVKMLYDDDGLYVIFRVDDRYVVCSRSENQTLTSKDSCVEVYLQPDSPQTTSARSARGYFNFEMNCGGALLLFYVLDPTRSGSGIFKHKHIVPQSLIDTMRIYHSLPKTLPAELTEPVQWTVEYFIPYALLENSENCRRRRSAAGAATFTSARTIRPTPTGQAGRRSASR